MKAAPRNHVRYWRSTLVAGGEMVTGRFTDHTYSPHWHDAYTVSIIESGAERYDYRGTKFIADAGSLPIINPGEIHPGSRDADGGWKCRTFYLPIEFMQTVRDELSLPSTSIPWFNANVIKDDDLIARASLAHRAMEQAADLLAAEFCLLDAVSTLLSRYSRERPAIRPMSPDRARVQRMKSRMLEELNASLSLTDVTSTVDLSTFHAARMFTREVGIAPHAWRNQIRILHARDALLAGVSIAEAAIASGFSDQSHFNRQFKKVTGVSPGRWLDAR